MIKAVVFDLDNTLYDYDRSNEIAMTRLEEYACNRYLISHEEFNDAFKLARENVKVTLGNTASAHNRMLYMQLFLEGIGRKPLDGALELYNMYWDTVLQNIRLYDYVRPLMDYLKSNGIKIAVLTDLTANIQHRKLCKLGLTAYIDVLVTSEEAGQEKPSKCIFERIVKKLKISPNEVLMIGDDINKDIFGAESIGMKTECLRPEYRETMYERTLSIIEGA